MCGRSITQKSRPHAFGISDAMIPEVSFHPSGKNLLWGLLYFRVNLLISIVTLGRNQAPFTKCLRQQTVSPNAKPHQSLVELPPLLVPHDVFGLPFFLLLRLDTMIVVGHRTKSGLNYTFYGSRLCLEDHRYLRIF